MRSMMNKVSCLAAAVMTIFCVLHVIFLSSKYSAISLPLAVKIAPKNLTPPVTATAHCECNATTTTITTTNRIKEFMKKSEEIWQASVARRHQRVAFEGSLSRVDPWGNSRGWMMWWDYFYPSYTCPYHLERIGKAGDAGKWVCGWSIFENSSSCIVYSFGVGDEVSFEKEIVDRSQNCQIWAYDHTVDVTKIGLHQNDRVHLKMLGLGSSKKENETEKIRTLASLMEDNGHVWIDILKMDVEGAEFESLNQILEDFDGHLPFGQLQIEFHVMDRKFQDFYQLWEKLEGRGLRAFHMEANDYVHQIMPRPNCKEYSFISVKNEKYNQLLHSD